LVENICPSHDLLMYSIFQGSLGASYKTFVILNSGTLDFVNFLSILRKFLHAKEKQKALYCVFDDDNHHCSCIW
jgi:Ca2+-binding EF-hand superfamily protein